MRKRLILILALAFVVGLSVAAYAEVQNIKVSGDLTLQGVARYRYQTDSVDDKEDAFLSALRVRLDADLTDNVATVVRLVNERAWGETSADNTDIDVDLAYATLKEFLYSPLTMTVGRQELRYGNAFIIGDANAASGPADSNYPAASAGHYGMKDLSMMKAFDAAKAVLNYDPLVLDLVYAKIEENDSFESDDVRLMGLNASYALNKDILTEAYLWSRDREWGSTGLTGTEGNGERLNVVGTRVAYSGIKNVTLGLEGAYQFGNHLSDTDLYPDDIRDTSGAPMKAKHRAYGIQLTSSLALPTVKYTPVLNFNWTRLSGDRDQTTKDRFTGWDAMYEDQAQGTIFNRIVGFSNCNLFDVGAAIRPMDDVTLRLNWYHIRLLSTYNTAADSTRRLSGIATDPTTTVVKDKRHLADEIDLGLIYNYTEDVQLGLTAGVYIPGSVYDKTNDNTASQVLGSMKVTF